MPKQRCPICDKAPLSGSVCPECGYDQSSDAETFGTLCAVLPVNKKTLAEQIRVYEEQRMITSRMLLQQTEQLSAPGDYSPIGKSVRENAEQGDAASQDKLGDCYYWGENVAKDYCKAVDWYRKAAQQGYASAQYHLGECYYYGKGVVQKYGTAVEWYRKAAQQGYASAQYSLANCYYNGKGVQRDLVIAADYYLLAKKQGNLNAEAAYSRLLKEATILDRKKLARHGHSLK